MDVAPATAAVRVDPKDLVAHGLTDLGIEIDGSWGRTGSYTSGWEGICSYIWRIFKAIITCQICEGIPSRKIFMKQIMKFTYHGTFKVNTGDISKIIASFRCPYEPTQATDKVVQDQLAPFTTIPSTAINVCITAERVDTRVAGGPSSPYSFQLFLSYNTPALPNWESPHIHAFPLEISV